MDEDKIRANVQQELRTVVSRLKRLSGPEELEQLPASLGSIFDDADNIQVDQLREMGLVTKSRLVTRMAKLVAALRRLDEGTYGACVECGDVIKAARLAALPEVETCLACQDRREREAGRQSWAHAA